MSDDNGVDWIARSGRRAKGRRPDYFADPAIDRLLSVVLALAGEVSVTRQRQDTLELLLQRHGSLNQEDIDTFVPGPEEAARRATETRAYIARIMRGVQQSLESLEAGDEPSVAELSERLREI